MDIKKVANGINHALEKRRNELNMSFEEKWHTYYMKDIDGKVKSNFPSVSKIMKKFYRPFNQEEMALKVANGDKERAKQLIEEWTLAGKISVNIGSRTHFLLEEDVVGQYDNFKELRQPEFECDDEQTAKSDKMVIAGKKYINLMHERGAVLIDTETVLGDPILGYTGQSDNTWLMENKRRNGLGIVVTDWKTNQPKNFEPQWYTEKMYKPFHKYDDTALGHYYIQNPLYGRLITAMLKGTKYENIKFLGGVVVLLKDDGNFVEYRVPQSIIDIVFSMNIKDYI